MRILNDVMRVENKRYVSFGDYSVTDLINPPRLTALRKRHAHEVTKDPQTQVGALIGTAIHELFEKNLKVAAVYDDKYVLERTVQDFVYIDDDQYSPSMEKRLITGRFDVLYDQKEMTDIKSCSTWKKIFDPKFEDWTMQQNLYAYLLSQRNIFVEKISVLVIYKDWSVGLTRDRTYPQQQVIEYELPLWDFMETGMILQKKVEEHVACENLADHELPACPEKDTWARFPGGATKQFAIMQSVKAKRADKVFKEGTINDVYKYVQERQAGQIAKKKPLPKSAFIEVRHAQRKRCETYCPFNKFCNHYGKYLEKKTNHNLTDQISLEAILS